MRKIESLKENCDIRRVFYKGIYANEKDIVLYSLKRRTFGQTLAISVSKKSGNAVERNRIKRIIRDAFRKTKELEKLKGCDIVIVGKKTAKYQKSTKIEEELKLALDKIFNKLRKKT